MSSYSHVVIATDFGDECEMVARKAREMVGSEGKLSLLHILEPLDSIYGGEAYGATAIQLQSIQDEINKTSQKHLDDFGGKLGVSSEDHHLIIGQHAREIRRFAKENQVDLIVVGSHGRHGLGLLLGSTANSILHGAECDVLAVRVHSAH